MAEQTMKLSEAIRCGAAETEQAFGEFVQYDGTRVACCAIGAAAYCFEKHLNDGEHAFAVIKEHLGIDLFKLHPVLDPRNGRRELALEMLIVELNDDAKWTREAIANYCESVGY